MVERFRNRRDERYEEALRAAANLERGGERPPAAWGAILSGVTAVLAAIVLLYFLLQLAL